MPVKRKYNFSSGALDSFIYLVWVNLSVVYLLVDALPAEHTFFLLTFLLVAVL